MKNSRFAFLDGMRGIAALFVVTRHTVSFWNLRFFRGYLAVDMFFILSGFVIAFAYDERLKNKGLTVSKFMLIRLVRLYPVFLCSVVLGCISFVLVDKLSGGQKDGMDVLFLLSALIVPFQFGPDEMLFPLNPPYWSLFFEIIANFFYAIFRQLLNTLVLSTVVFTSGVALVAIACLHGNLDVGFSWGYKNLIAGLCRAIFGISVGLLLHRKYSFISRYLGNPIFPWIGLLIVVCFLASPSAGHFDYIIDILAVIAFFPFAVAAGSSGAESAWQGVLLTLGTASYPIYVLHKPVGDLISYGLNGLERTTAPLSGVVLVAMLILLSVWIERYFDLPVRRWLSTKMRLNADKRDALRSGSSDENANLEISAPSSTLETR